MATLVQERAPQPEVTVRVVADQASARPGGRDGRGGRGGGRGGGIAGLIRTVLLGGAIVVAALIVGGALGLFHLSNPFSTRTVDHTPAVLLRRFENLSEYRAASANFEVVVDAERDVKFVPSFVAGQRAQYLAVGSVDATVDFGRVAASDVRVGGGGEAVVRLPHARIGEAVVDTKRSHITNRDRGLIDRVGSVFVDTPTSDRDLLLMAETKMEDSARRTNLRERAERNTREMLRDLLSRLGYGSVRVEFGPAQAAR